MSFVWLITVIRQLESNARLNVLSPNLSDIVRRSRSVRWNFHYSAGSDWYNHGFCHCCISHSVRTAWRNRFVTCNNHCRYSDHLNSRRESIDRFSKDVFLIRTSFAAWAIMASFIWINPWNLSRRTWEANETKNSIFSPFLVNVMIFSTTPNLLKICKGET